MTKIGRNDRCPCGSGKKYKNCCEGKATRMSVGSWITLAAIAAAVVVVAYFVVAGATDDTRSSSRRCPPGQVWSQDHNHCH